jgi:cytochrome c-type biogenesis protein CcmE
MNKISIIGLILIGISVFIFMNASKDVSTYSNFKEAISSGERVKVVGKLNKLIPTSYDALNSPNIFKFHMTDDKGLTKEVILNKAKPQDFERSEQIVITGEMKGDQFIADEILMKCPSKYKQEEINIKKG